LYRRVTITAVVAGVLLLLIVGFYFAYQASNALNPYIGKPVTSADLATLRKLSLASYGPSGTSMLSDVKSYNGTAFAGKPLVVFIGADYCEYCAVQRWSLIMALMRFGNFSNLTYMASSVADGNYPTFSFYGSTYTSQYLVFQGFEQDNRAGQPLQTVPSNYSTIHSQYGGGFPFMDFGNRYIVAESMLEPQALGGQNWAGVFNDINTSNTIGSQIKVAANVITALICKLTNNQPSSVCDQSSIASLTTLLVSYNPASLGTVLQAQTLTFSVSQSTAAPTDNQRD
jgi:hypothetical protein